MCLLWLGCHPFFFFLNYLFIYFWLCWVFVSVRGLSLVAASGGHSSSRCAGLSLSRPLVAEHRLQMRRLSSCGSRAQLLRGMWDLPRPGLEPMSPALAGRLSTTAPPGKPQVLVLMLKCESYWEMPVIWRDTRQNIWNRIVLENTEFVFIVFFSFLGYTTFPSFRSRRKIFSPF